MAGLPEINVPSEGSAVQPAPSLPMPSQEAFGTNVADGLTGAGRELFGVGLTAYHKAAEAHAQDMETEFQVGALKIRDNYRNMYNGAAVKGHEAATQMLQQLRQKVGENISSQYGSALYKNNSLRRMGLVQESLDQHFEQQNKSYQMLQLKKLNNADVDLVTALSTDKQFNSAGVESLINGIKERTKTWAQESGGMDPDTAEKYATQETYKATDGLFTALLDSKSDKPASLVAAELEKYKKQGMVDPRTLERAQHGIGGAETNSWVAQSMANLNALRINDDKKSDPEGFIPHEQLTKQIDSLKPDDPMRQKKIDLLTSEYERSNRDFDKAGAQLEGIAVRKIQLNGGKVPENDMDWQRFQQLYSVRAKQIAQSTGNQQWTVSRRAEINDKNASRQAFGATHAALSAMSQDQLKDITPATVDQLMRTNYSGKGLQPSGEDMAHAQDYLKKVQSGKLDPIEKQFNSIASQTLMTQYKGDRAKVAQQMGNAHMLLDDMHSADPKLTETDLRQKLAAQFTKPGWFDSRPGEKYAPRPSDARQSPVDHKWYRPVPGKPGKFAPWEGN